MTFMGHSIPKDEYEGNGILAKKKTNYYRIGLFIIISGIFLFSATVSAVILLFIK